MIDILNNTNSQILAAIILGLAVALNPCIIAANISALSFSSEGKDNNDIIKRGFLFITGRILALTLLGVLLHYFADKTAIEEWFKIHIGKIIGPAFILIGLLLLDIIHIHIHSEMYVQKLKQTKISNSFYAPFVIGFVVAFAFCPEGAAMYFGSMVPLLANCNTNNPATLSFCFALGSIIPILPIIYILSKGKEKLETFKANHVNLEAWTRRIIASLFLIAGLLFVIEYYFE